MPAKEKIQDSLPTLSYVLTINNSLYDRTRKRAKADLRYVAKLVSFTKVELVILQLQLDAKKLICLLAATSHIPKMGFSTCEFIRNQQNFDDFVKK